MRKVFVCAIAFMALMFASCGNKQSGNAAPNDSTATDSTIVAGDSIDEAEAVANDMQAKLDAKDAKGLNEIVATAKQKIDELVKEGKVEEAKAYASKVKQFIDDNAEAIKTVTNGNETISSIVSTINALPSSAEGTVKAAGEAVKSDAENAVKTAKDAAETKVSEAKEAAKKKATDEVNKAKDKANEEVNKAASKALNKLGL